MVAPLSFLQAVTQLPIQDIYSNGLYFILLIRPPFSNYLSLIRQTCSRGLSADDLFALLHANSPRRRH